MEIINILNKNKNESEQTQFRLEYLLKADKYRLLYINALTPENIYKISSTKFIVIYPICGKALSTVLDSDLEQRQRSKKLSEKEFWGRQVLDTMTCVSSFHQKSIATGSIAPRNILYQLVGKTCFGIMHVPGLVNLDFQQKSKVHSVFPYYDPAKDTISIADEVVAVCVLLMECILADVAKWRMTWKEYMSCPEAHYKDLNPLNVIKKHLNVIRKGQWAGEELLSCFDRLISGQEVTMKQVIDAFT